MGVRVLMIAEEGAAREAYATALEGLGVEFDSATAVGDMAGALSRVAYNGIVLDVPTMLKAQASERTEVYNLLEMFPVMRLRWDPQAKAIRALFYGQTRETGGTVKDFIEQECAAFPRRTIRSATRVCIHLNGLLSRSPVPKDGEAERTVTVNISEKGMFIFSASDWRDALEAWIVIRELSDQSPIRLGVRWTVPWGERSAMPGIGTAILEASPAQVEEIRQRIGC